MPRPHPGPQEGRSQRRQGADALLEILLFGHADRLERGEGGLQHSATGGGGGHAARAHGDRGTRAPPRHSWYRSPAPCGPGGRGCRAPADALPNGHGSPEGAKGDGDAPIRPVPCAVAPPISGSISRGGERAYRTRDTHLQRGGGILRHVKFAVVNFAVGNFAEPLDLVWHPPPESTVCTAGVQEIRGEPGISRGKFHGQFETRNSHGASPEASIFEAPRRSHVSCGGWPRSHFFFFSHGVHAPHVSPTVPEGVWGLCPNNNTGGGVGTRPWWLALLACGGAYWPLAFEPFAMTSGHPHYCGHPPSWGGIQNATSAHGVLP